ncbi:uncharacterized protein MAM_06338 [Metarhizium album ARSEF 1941]|uniref:Secreted protein n=1 Tax=Metarhizium album (strain ARSEF 1941) TaxID=1081103 RepID=A0A0B2WI77_METAS|nr:uncharacterized protein MAM_06338 [Metarhizium album ARSEF 1941]KHN95726.1 hypothetical protein MAM_06338 [Metarhizium album ARSEF 1941]
MRSRILATLCLLVLLAPAAAARALDSPPPAFRVKDKERETGIKPGGPTAHVKGTTEEAVSQLRTIIPAFGHGRNLTGVATGGDAPGDDIKVGPDPRPDDLALHCFGPSWPTSNWAVHINYEYVKQLRGRPKSPLGPAECRRVSCLWDTAVFWCNETTELKRIYSYNSITAALLRIMRGCIKPTDDFRFYANWGKASHPDGWHVKVGAGWC